MSTNPKGKNTKSEANDPIDGLRRSMLVSQMWRGLHGSFDQGLRLNGSRGPAPLASAVLADRVLLVNPETLLALKYYHKASTAVRRPSKLLTLNLSIPPRYTFQQSPGQLHPFPLLSVIAFDAPLKSVAVTWSSTHSTFASPRSFIQYTCSR